MATDSPIHHPLLTEQIAFDSAGDFAAFLEQAPGRWAVYLLLDADGRPFQLLSVKNLRASLANRLCEHPADEKTRSIPYRQVVRRISFRRVDSAVEADWIYLTLARELLPDAYRKLLESWRPWYIAIDPSIRLPKWLVTDHPEEALAATTFGPITTKSAAQKLVETIEDAFDLCRYYHILAQAPHGKACPYKQMHKCPAPCDGSISMPMYYQQLEMSLAALRKANPAAEHELRMRQAAGALQFELAGRIKSYMQQLASLRAAGSSVDKLRFVALCRGSKAKAFKLMLLTPENVQLSGEWSSEQELSPMAAALAQRYHHVAPWDESSQDRLALIARHVLLESPDAILLRDPEVATIMAATARLARRKVEAQSSDEGMVQEAQ